MEKYPKPTRNRAQLFASFVPISLVMVVGLVCVAWLGDKLDDARLDHQEMRARRWVRSVISDLEEDFVLGDLVEVSDPRRLGTSAKASLYHVRRHGVEFATAMKWVAENGYNGAIDLAIAVDGDGAIIGFRVLAHRETRGFGDVIADPESNWIRSFRGRSLDNPKPLLWQLHSDGGAIDGLSGATITAGALVAGIAKALQYLNRLQANYDD